MPFPFSIGGRLAAAATALLLAPGVARAEPVRVHGRFEAAVPATGPQRKEQGLGVAAGATVEWPVIPQLGFGLGIGAVTLSDGEPPEDAALVDEDGASGLSGGLSLHLRPSASSTDDPSYSPRGLWGGTRVGVMRSDGAYRLMSEVSFGYDFLQLARQVAAGPSVGWLHVFQPDSELRPADANVLSVGFHASFGAAPAAKPPLRPPAPKAEEKPADRDGDGVADRDDRCPDAPEDRDEFQDADGCPDPDNDADRIEDAADRCPMQAEDRDAFEDEDGCPDPDNDQDGVPDAVDQCPLEMEDADGHLDEDGCPDPDNDGDGFLDVVDQCPLEPETKNGYADEDGCPDTKEVRVVGDKIVLDDRIHFWKNSSNIRARSHLVLGKLSRLLNEHPEYVHVEIQGHTDSRGDEALNEQLSRKRAAAVLHFLVERGGVDPTRLESKGFGSTRPRTLGTDEYDHFLNRRVEFHITRERVKRGPW